MRDVPRGRRPAMHGTLPLATPRLLLRRFSPADAPAMYTVWAGDAAVTRFLRWQPHKSAAETRSLLEAWAAQYACGGFYNWAVVRRADGVLMGAIGAVPAEDGAGLLEPGYALGRRYWGQGYATEALAAVVRYLFESEGQAALACCHAHENPASGRVMKKCGFRPVCNGVYTINTTVRPCPAAITC